MASIYDIDNKICACVDFESGEIIDQEQLDALQIERAAKIEGIACWIKNLESDAAEIKAEETALADRRKAKEAKADALKKYLQFALNDCPFESAKCKVTFRRSTQVNIIDESKIPAEYLKVVAQAQIDKKALGAALKLGELIEGVELKEKSNIQIK